MTRCMTLCLLLAACGSTDDSGRPRTFGGDRLVTLQTPQTIDFDRRYPLVLVLHGYGATGFGQQAYFGLGAPASRDEAFVLAPDGMRDSNNRQFWNADSVCCDFDRKNPDDVGYLGGVVEDVIRSWPIDRKAILVAGHSNGGFMAYRLACERADLFTNIIALAGNAVMLPCQPQVPVGVLHIHGTADETIAFAGARPSFSQWAARNGCADTTDRGTALDLDASVPGAETRTETAAGCPPGASTSLWTIDGGRHVPPITGQFEPAVWPWFMANHRP